MLVLVSNQAILNPLLPTASVMLPDDSFVGRQQETTVLKRAFDSGRRLVTISGIGGAGKTRLALEFARTYTETAIVIDLSAAREVTDLTIAMAGVLSGQCPDETPNGIAVGLATLEDALFVLDAVEGILPEACSVISQWHRSAPGVRFLVTSRIPLGAASEQVILLTALDASDSMTLLVDRASALNFRFDPDEDRQSLQRVLEQLEGIPLAIELAAARTQTLSPDQLSQRLDEPLRVLRSHLRDVSPRHAAMEATLEWSWELLTPAERSVLARLLVFHKSFSIRAAEAIASVDGERPNAIISILESLVQHGLLRLVETPSGRRLRLIGVVRDYVGRHLSDDERDAVEQRHTRFFVELIEPLVDAEDFARQLLDDCDPVLIPEVENLESIVERSSATVHDRVCATLALVAILSRLGPASRLQRILDLTTEHVRLDPGATTLAKLQLELAKAYAKRFLRTTGPSEEELTLGYETALEKGALPLAALLQHFLAREAILQGDIDNATTIYEAAYQLALRSESDVAIAQCIQGLAIIPFRQGYFDEALVAAKEVISLADRLRYRRTRWNWLQNYSVALYECGRIEEALQAAARVRTLIEEAESLDLLTINVSLLAEYSASAGKLQDARHWLAEGQKLLDNRALRSSHPRDGFHILRFWLALTEGDMEAAEAALAPGHWRQRPSQISQEQAVAEGCRALIVLLRGRPSAAIQNLNQSLPVRRQIPDQQFEVLIALGFLAVAHAMMGDAKSALSSLEDAQQPQIRSLRVKQVLTVLELATRAALSEPDAIAKSRTALSAIRRGDGPWVAYVELVVAARLLERVMADVDARGGRTLRIGKDLAWIQVDSSPVLNLRRRRVPQRLIRCLLQARERSIEDAVPTDRLLDAAWPNDKASRASLENRLWATLSKLRRAGLDGVIERIDRGYRIHPEVKVDESPTAD